MHITPNSNDISQNHNVIFSFNIFTMLVAGDIFSPCVGPGAAIRPAEGARGPATRRFLQSGESDRDSTGSGQNVQRLGRLRRHQSVSSGHEVRCRFWVQQLLRRFCKVY